MDRTIIPTDQLTQRHPLPGIALRDSVWMTTDSPEPGKVLAWFNCSSITHKGKRWFVYRTECLRWFMWSRINLVQLDENFTPVPGTNVILPLHTRFDGWGAEDPRIFIFDGRMHIAYGDGYRMLLAELNDDGTVVRSMAIPADEVDQNPPHKFPREKNWGFFEFDGRLFCQYSVNPTVTFEFDGDWKVINRWSQPWRWASDFGKTLHGGSSPVFHNNLLWRWVHCYRAEKLPFPRKSWWSDKLLHTGHRYYPHLICFSPEPPFAPVAHSALPVFHSEWEPKGAEGLCVYHSVAYVGSCERESNGWRLFYGENDCRVVTAWVPDETATKSMKVADKPKPKKTRPPQQNFLHFIWLQGEDKMFPEDAMNVQEWRNKNSDWTIQFWDDQSIPDIIRAKAVVWMPIWQELSELRANKPDDTALIAKASDLARLILLSIRFSAEQQWNVYADTDTRPNRPLTDFLNDDKLYGTNIAKRPFFTGVTAERDWDIDNFDFLIPEENLLNPLRGYLTNAVLMSRPGSSAITAILKAGVLTRRQPTLQAWGPIMLRKTIGALQRTGGGRRIFVLPFHYLVWNPAQMQEPQPAWSVCSHLNRFRWKQEGIRASVAGSARAKMSLA
jgi:hypothetical protein